MTDPLTLTYQAYESAKKAGDELEAIRLWVIFLDLLNAQKPNEVWKWSVRWCGVESRHALGVGGTGGCAKVQSDQSNYELWQSG